MRVLIANRGEISIRIARAARNLGWHVAMVHSADDAGAAFLDLADTVHPLPGIGPRAYLDIAQIIRAAQETESNLVHPGYGFLSESAALASACEAAGLVFAGPAPETLELLGDKSRARAAAQASGVPIPKGLEGPISRDDARAFLLDLGKGGAAMLKAVAGGGGRGTRPVSDPSLLDEAFSVCQAEAMSAFGEQALYIEELITEARHIEVQVLADTAGNCMHLFERECTLQRNRQKLIEMAPSSWLAPDTRAALFEAAVSMAKAVHLKGLATFEFLVRTRNGTQEFFFIEANPRLQVEHTVTEEVTGIDLVESQLRIAAGVTLDQMGLPGRRPEHPKGLAIQCRINAEQMTPDGAVLPSAGTISAVQLPGGPHVRVDTSARAGYMANPAFDSLLAKVIVTEPSADYEDALKRARSALSEIRIEGCDTNTTLLQALLADEAVTANTIDTNYIDRNIGGLVHKAAAIRPSTRPMGAAAASAPTSGTALPLPAGTHGAEAPLAGIVAEILVTQDQEVRAGEPVMLLEAMKMQHAVTSPCDGIVVRIDAGIGLAVTPGRTLVVIQPQSVMASGSAAEARRDPDHVRDDLAIVHYRHDKLQDPARPDAVSRRHARNQRTVRENIANLCDPGSFVEYGGLTIAAQRARRSHQELIDKSPADGMIAGIGSINGDLFPEQNTQCAILAYDYTVFAGTQGALNHKKKDRMLELTARTHLPVIILGEGGGGRPGDTDIRLGLDVPTFAHFARLKNKVPIVGIVSGYCFAGNAALVGCADALIATRNSSIGMGGPAMIEGGGLGTVAPEEIGPSDMQTRNGVIDILVEDEDEAISAAKKFLSYFQGRSEGYNAPDQRLLRHIIPENRKRVFQVRDVIETLADTSSMLELRPHFGPGMITALIRIDGHPIGLIANNNEVMSGAIDADAARKAADFLDLCNVHGLPVLSLCDTPGFMVGPEVEQQGQVKEACRMFVAGASLKVPLFAVVLRKAYGLGAQAMVGGCFHSPVFSVSWPTGEFGGMGLEGAVRLGYRRELEAISDEIEKAAFFDEKLQELYEDGKALTVAEFMEIDDVIDPAETRTWIIKGLEASAASRT